MELAIGGDQTQKFSSIYLVEQINLFRVQEGNRAEIAHKTFLAKVEERFSKEIGEQKILPTSYLDKSNRDSKMYELSYKDSLRILVTESNFVADAVIEVLEKQQAEIKRLTMPNFTDPAEAAIAWANEYKAKQLAESQVQKMKPKADFYDAVTESSDTTDIGTAAKVLQLGYGRTILFEKLRKAKVLMPDNKPYQKYIDLGWFRVIESSWNKPDGSSHVYFKTVVFQKGMDGILKILK